MDGILRRLDCIRAASPLPRPTLTAPRCYGVQVGRHRKPDSESARHDAVPQTGTGMLPPKNVAATPLSYGARSVSTPPRLDTRRPAADLTRTGYTAAPPLRDNNRLPGAADRPTHAGDRPFGHPEQHRTRTTVGHRQQPADVREPRGSAGAQHKPKPAAKSNDQSADSPAGSLIRRSGISGKQVDLFKSRTGETTIDVIDASAVEMTSAVAVLDRPTRREVPAEDDEELVRLWTFFVGQAAIAAIIGLLLWLASYWQWRHAPYLAAITSPVVLIGMLVGAQQICLRRQPSQGLDLFTTGVVLGVGMLLTVLPAAFVLRPL